MLPKPLFLAAGLVCVMVVPVFSQSLEISRLEDKKDGNAAVSSAPSAQSYIIDVSGKTVRLVGPQFLPDSARGLEFPGRGSDHNNTGAETHVLRQRGIAMIYAPQTEAE